MQRYQNAEETASSDPLMNRMALCARFTNYIHLEVKRVPFEKLSSLDGDEPSSASRARVEAARAAGQATCAGQWRYGPGPLLSSSGNKVKYSASARWTERARVSCAQPCAKWI